VSGNLPKSAGRQGGENPRRMLDLAARLALRGAGLVEPNPMVGCVIVKDGRVIGMGHHRVFGGLHAERDALAACAAAGEDPRGATVYCTLEPCNGTGKQPPCVEALIAAKVARVVYARRDPNALKAGGHRALEAAGISCALCEESRPASGLSAPFEKLVTTDLPWVVAKWAQTIDGRVATRAGESKWITSARTRARVHRLRARVDAVLVGVGTVLADDPMLTARDVRRVRRTAIRVVLDTSARTPPASALVRSAREVPVVVIHGPDAGNGAIEALRAAGVATAEVGLRGGRVDARAALAWLRARMNVATVLVEAGPALLGSLVRDGLVDEARVHVGPRVMGDEGARGAVEGLGSGPLAGVPRFVLAGVRRVGEDVEMVYRASNGQIAKGQMVNAEGAGGR
jgi:diaminohydroxyphosphoribosylaminopyrimidine deaminase/5-amino-6-(5-phosphoribosylamino)uracil reductase